jgi:ankyrin repeat protein
MGHGGFLEIISVLVKNGCSVNFLDEFGKSPIFYASELGQDDTLEILLNAKADPDV